jgi:hypothetical protein
MPYCRNVSSSSREHDHSITSGDILFEPSDHARNGAGLCEKFSGVAESAKVKLLAGLQLIVCEIMAVELLDNTPTPHHVDQGVGVHEGVVDVEDH